ncbi:MAG: hypothetical protein AAFY34_11745 [Pseudomonadota bacterium]
MRTYQSVLLSVFVALALHGAPSTAQDLEVNTITDAEGRVLFIYDSSNSMWGELTDGSRKYEAGRSAMAAILNTGLSGREIGFRAYGHRRTNDCRDSELVVPFSPDNTAATPINQTMASLRPTGKTPITYSLTEGLKDLNGGPGEILLISDGIETCDADPCDLMRQWKASNVDIRVHVVGVGLNEVERVAMTCIADESGGVYFDADSTEGFEEALSDVSEVIETVDADPQDDSTPIDGTTRYALVVVPTDSTGRRYVDAEGRLIRDGEVIIERTVSQGRGRNAIEEPGDYELEVGVLLKDGSIYEPVRVPVSITDPGDTILQVEVPAPPRINAVFTENGAPHDGALIYAYQDNVEVFRFRASEEAHAPPGTYIFRSSPNQDNPLEQTATLAPGELTTLEFELVQTVRIFVTLQRPDGEIIQPHIQLWQDGEHVYTARGSNGAKVRPGTYEVRYDDQNAPVSGVALTVDATDGKTYTLPVQIGWVKIIYPPSEYGYVGTPDRAWLGSVERGGSSYAQPNTSIAVAPGQYTVEGFDARGFFELVTVDVPVGETVDAILTPEPLGEIIIEYAPSDSYEVDPTRAFIRSLDGHRILGAGTFTPGDVRRLRPGRYIVEGWSRVGNVAPQEITITAEARETVTLHLASE